MMIIMEIDYRAHPERIRVCSQLSGTFCRLKMADGSDGQEAACDYVHDHGTWSSYSGADAMGCDIRLKARENSLEGEVETMEARVHL